MSKCYLYVSILTFAAIACIAPAAIANTPVPKMRLSSPVTGTPETDKQMTDNQMTVAGNLNLRSCAGETCPVITTLSDGDIVTFTTTPPVTLFVYAWHEVTVDVEIDGVIINLTGWVNTRWLY